MEKERILILDEKRIHWKLQRMAYQIWEHNSKRSSIILIGIENGGLAVANALAIHLRQISSMEITVCPLKMNKKKPLESPAGLDMDLNGKSVVLVDDVANSGKTLLYAIKAMLAYEPDSIMVAVLVDRQHKSFPITPDIVGHTVSTTLQEHIEVEISDEHVMAAYLK